MLFKDVCIVFGIKGKIYVITAETKWEPLGERSSYNHKAILKVLLGAGFLTWVVAT